MTSKSRTTRQTHATPSGFTLIELLLAMFIFALGLSAVAAIFPAATYLQKQTLEEVITLQVKRNAESILESRGIPEAVLSAATSDVQAVPNLTTHLPVADRSYPTGSSDAVGERSFYWVPLVKNNGTSTTPDWQAFVFILAKRRDATYSSTSGGKANPSDGSTVPLVVRASVSSIDDTNAPTSTSFSVSGAAQDALQPGDQILLSTGQIAAVIEADGTAVTVGGALAGTPSHVWFGVPHQSGRHGPTRRIIAMGSEAVQ